MDAFTVSVNFVLQHEGGYVNNQNDPGGETNFGISKREYPKLDIKAMTRQQAVAIYQSDYWKPLQADDKPFGLACAMLDTAVNCGVSKALKLAAQSTDPVQYLNLRLAYYNWLAQFNPKEAVFLPGWKNRVNDLKKYIEIHSHDV